ncbi:sulfatase-like hydrolase/transferase [Pelagicoccus sp. SDUM812005]|uniref:sulfatase-like hydrolase/transferase n=1 Tax=Pelagicoccus sp. SDUM812005 TaxID=3041257 RepID=UPI00280ED136|nr:sulfatase-like hydrolase/transferase [Pelagicoccus sp. SDUM812005]MDQ8183788.1 sulfatase-like hydrolase/transferase [Pelagicoccus sp. SDUM812005]
MNTFCSCFSFLRSGCRTWALWNLLAALSSSAALGGDDLAVCIDTHLDGRPISYNLVGLHQVYTFTPDPVFEEGDFAEWVEANGFSVSRFPGGTTVKYWDWEAPTGQPFKDPMLPTFDSKLNEPESEWMSVDEYLDFVEATGMTPLIGVNSYIGAVHGKELEMIEKAVRLVRHVKERGFGGGFWYIGNEEMHKHGGPAEHARAFRKYATRMKAEDPNIKVFWNDNNPSKKSVREFLENDGGTADGLETHGKWPYGGSPELPPASYEEWLGEVPLRDRKNGDRKSGGRVWRYAADEYRSIARSMGRDLLVANNEYGFGSANNMGSFSRFQKGLLATEFLMELYIGNWDMTAFWDLALRSEDGVLDRQNGFRVNPAGEGMALLAEVQGGTFLHAVKTGKPSVHGFAARKDGVVYLYLLNKTGDSHRCDISLDPAGLRKVELQTLTEGEDGYGKLMWSSRTIDEGSPAVELPAMSFARITVHPLEKVASARSARTLQEKPNIIWLMAEDIGLDLECYGMKGVSTPNLNRLAEEGTRYTGVYCPSPICSPNRSAMMVGVDRAKIGAQHHRSKRNQPLPAPYKPMTYWLKEGGYTNIIGSDLVMGKGTKIDCNFKTKMLGSYDGVTQFGLFDKKLEYTEEDQPFF